MKQYRKIANLVMMHTKVDIFSNRKTQEIVDARGLFDHIMYVEFGSTYQSLSDFYYSNGKIRNHSVLIYSVKNYANDISQRRKDFKEILYRILTTEITRTKYKNVVDDVSKISTVKGLDSVKAFVKRTLVKELEYKESDGENVDQVDLLNQIEELT
jgi:hypothetical protein